MKKHYLTAILCAAVVISANAAVVPIAATTAATTAGIAAANNNAQKQAETRKHAEQQAQVVTQIAQQGGLTVEAGSGHVIIRCEWVKGGLCQKRILSDEGWFGRYKYVSVTPEEFAKKEGYNKVHRITLLPLYDNTWLALDVSKE
ncbi:hypothetical protein [Rodentibacter pneumotropicus]|uniref:Uncharacterized protein n=1 Tax=Rodentibacter pneumotropicus TaxID=758 RepID=A0A3S4U7K5_9PAST|nr:hypothetical protein [Rodentibacter pneumotropicus]NBH76189.1 hypothetical protein [Rodentibacter pneumotropicus]THA08353.1 hypothetical protein D3M73_00210 [Rodentibacter pneumotropicus]THA12575.1 hypothetical protein D3M81_05020 [Rodentibacter pneumotropicus]VEH67142.1 Uncharacterised protein [Rodentibacter pneumotropicus]